MGNTFNKKFELLKMPPSRYLRRYKGMLDSVQEISVLSLGVSCGLFDRLQKVQGAEELARANGWNEIVAARLLQCMQAYGFIKKAKNGYQNNAFAAYFAAEGSPYSQTRSLQLFNSGNDLNKRIIYALLNGPPRERPPITDVFNSQVLLGMAEHCVRGGVQQTIALLNKLNKIKAAKKMLDLGGGHALYSIGLTFSNPGLASTIFDLPEVVEKASKAVVKSHGAERIGFIAGDFMTDDLGDGYDFVLCSDVLHRTKEEILSLLAKIHRAMAKGGILAVKETHLDSLQKNRFASYFALVLSSFDTEQRVFPSKEFQSLIERAGFKVRQSFAVDAASDSSRLTIAERI